VAHARRRQHRHVRRAILLDRHRRRFLLGWGRRC
jgi:hypothetical protein